MRGGVQQDERIRLAVTESEEKGFSARLACD
jgi:hypothetical protein